MMFKNAGVKFSKQLGKCWAEYIGNYDKMFRDYNLRDEQKRQCQHNLLRNDSARFYATAEDPQAATFQIVAGMISAQYN